MRLLSYQYHYVDQAAKDVHDLIERFKHLQPQDRLPFGMFGTA